jgi:DNA-binding response OmpR family regulator
LPTGVSVVTLSGRPVMLSYVPGVLLVARDWRTRALLRAQLIEEGLAVKAFESIWDATGALGERSEELGLVVVELLGRESAEEIEQLSAWAARVPVWVIASRSLAGEAWLEKCGFEAVVFRPIDVGDLVERIKRRIR